MKISWSLALIGAACVLGGCASTNSSYAVEGRYSPVSTESDMAYVQAVEAAARRSGVGVIWVHPPRKAIVEQN